MLALCSSLLLAVPAAELTNTSMVDDRLRRDRLKCYALRYPDLLHGYCKDDSNKCDFDGLEMHFKESGITERRILGCVAEDVKCYARRYPDLAAAYCQGHFKSCTHDSYIELLKHFSVAGLKEGREFGCRAEVSREEMFVDAIRARKDNNKRAGAQACAVDVPVARNLSQLLADSLETPGLGIVHDQAQTHFVVQKICNETRARQTVKICEVGFKTGHMALLLLESVPNSSVLSFGHSDTKPSSAAAQLLSQAYKQRFQVVFGSPTLTVPTYHRIHPADTCDVIVMDDARDYGERLLDIANMKGLASPGSLLILRQICSKECARSPVATWGETKLPCSSCRGGGTVAYSKAHQLGLIHVLNCSVPATSSARSTTLISSQTNSTAETPVDGSCTAIYANLRA